MDLKLKGPRALSLAGTVSLVGPCSCSQSVSEADTLRGGSAFAVERLLPSWKQVLLCWRSVQCCLGVCGGRWQVHGEESERHAESVRAALAARVTRNLACLSHAQPFRNPSAEVEAALCRATSQSGLKLDLIAAAQRVCEACCSTGSPRQSDSSELARIATRRDRGRKRERTAAADLGQCLRGSVRRYCSRLSRRLGPWVYSSAYNKVHMITYALLMASKHCRPLRSDTL